MFTHKEHGMILPKLTRETTDKGRRYFTSSGDSFPSVTTVLSILSKQSIQEWRDTGIPDIAYEYGLRWGGDFGTPDKVHFDMGNYYAINDLRTYLTSQLAYNPTMEGYDIILPVS